MKISLIVAMASNKTIGKENDLPWHIPSDLKRFKKLTTGNAVIMGRKTYETLGKPLPDRHNIIITRNLDYNIQGVTVVHSLLEAFVSAECGPGKEAFVIGGAQIYGQALRFCNHLHLTLIDSPFDGDAKFDANLQDWLIVHHETFISPLAHQYFILERKSDMTQWLTLERLSRNNLPKPQYHTLNSAGLDFAACLNRVCKKVEHGTGAKSEFWAAKAGVRIPIIGSILEPEVSKDIVLSISPRETLMIPLGFKCSFSPTCFLALYVRSSIGIMGLRLANGTGIIDPDFRGELFAVVHNYTDSVIDVKDGERIVQGVLTYFSQAIVKEDLVDQTERGTGGYGSTGQMATADTVTGLPPESMTESSSASTPRSPLDPPLAPPP